MPKSTAPIAQYDFPLENFTSIEKFQRLKAFASGRETPCLILDLEVIKAKYEELKANLPYAKIYYGVKANPHDEVLALLRDLGSCFVVASRYELDQLLKLGVSPDRMTFGNTIKKKKDIAYFFERGVRLYATDSISDLNMISDAAPGSKVYFRLLTDGLGADWPLSKKLGCQPDLVRQLVKTAVRFGLQPYGISFHPGSQQRDVGQWSTALTTVGQLFRSIREEIHVDLKMVNMGGGLPANYLEPSDSIASYAENIRRFMDNSFKEGWPEEIIIEPGRSMAGDAGVVVAEIVNIAKKSVHERYTWVFLDVGKFGGLIETLDESIKYPIFFEGSGKAIDTIIAGPTCDSMDILYEKLTYTMPESARIGDRVYIFTAGAYTQSYSSIYFNGFPPLAVYVQK
ncbi:MAG: type III PLP-dependent enzyme [Rectinemataceae bacterium]|jgi:ornithine decarboxylase